MNRFASLVGCLVIAVLEGGFASGLIAFLSFFLHSILNGYFLFDDMYGIVFVIMFCVLGTMFGLVIEIALWIVTVFFFTRLETKQTSYRFVAGTIGLIVASPILHFAWNLALKSVGERGYAPLDFLAFLVIITTLTNLFISQRLASRHIKGKSEKAKNSDLI